MPPILLSVKSTENASYFQAFAELDNSDDLAYSWKVCTKVKDVLEHGNRLENLSWRLWHLHSSMVASNKMPLTDFKKMSEFKARRLEKETCSPMPTRAALSQGAVDPLHCEANAQVSSEKSVLLKTEVMSESPSFGTPSCSTVSCATLSDTSEHSQVEAMECDEKPCSSSISTSQTRVVEPLKPAPGPSDEELLKLLDPGSTLFEEFMDMSSLFLSSDTLNPPVDQSMDSYSPHRVVPPLQSYSSNDFSLFATNHNVYGSSLESIKGATPTTRSFTMSGYRQNIDAFLAPTDSLMPFVDPFSVCQPSATTPIHNMESFLNFPVHQIPISSRVNMTHPNNGQQIIKEALEDIKRSSVHASSCHQVQNNLQSSESLMTESVQNPSNSCRNCGVTHTPLWRRSANEELLCNACGLYQKAHQANRPRNLKFTASRKQLPDPNFECANCQTKNTPLWRKDDLNRILCNACGLYRKLHAQDRPLSMKSDVVRKRHRDCESKKRRTNE